MKPRPVKKKWSDKKDFLVYVDVFNVDIIFILNCTEKECHTVLRNACGKNYTQFDKENLADWDKEDSNLGRCISFKAGFVVLLRGQKNFREFIGTMVHEINHVVHYLLRERRIPLNKKTEEVYCYTLECITKNALLQLYD